MDTNGDANGHEWGRMDAKKSAAGARRADPSFGNRKEQTAND